ncbi:hypothetical protein ACVNHC_24415 [Pannonibacter sp. Q-1]
MVTLEEAELKLQQTKALIKQLKAKEKAEERKRDTRRKILYGAGLMALKDRPDVAAIMREIEAMQDDRNKALFSDGKTAKGDSQSG